MPCEDARTGETPAERLAENSILIFLLANELSIKTSYCHRSANGGVSQSAVVSGVRSLLHETYLVTGASLLRGRNVVVSPFTSFNLEDLQVCNAIHDLNSPIYKTSLFPGSRYTEF